MYAAHSVADAAYQTIGMEEHPSALYSTFKWFQTCCTEGKYID